jgi:hypothetical protein
MANRSSLTGRTAAWAAAGAFISLSAAAALAQTVPVSVQTRIVPAGVKRQLGFFTSLNPDCTPSGEIVARLKIHPTKGEAEIDQGPGYPNFDSLNQRYHCNGKLIEGYRINYRSDKDFNGTDVFEVEFFTPNGQQVVWKYSVSVK